MSIHKIYETTFIINAALEDPDIESIITRVTNYIENLGADIIQVNKWGRRRLAYPINKKFNGYYVHIIYEASPSIIPIFERFMVLEDTILRHLTLALPKKLREYRLKTIAEGKATEIAPQEAPAEPKKEASSQETDDTVVSTDVANNGTSEPTNQENN